MDPGIRQSVKRPFYCPVEPDKRRMRTYCLKWPALLISPWQKLPVLIPLLYPHQASSLKLLDDAFVENLELAVNSNITLDLNGHVLYGNSDDSKKYVAATVSFYRYCIAQCKYTVRFCIKVNAAAPFCTVKRYAAAGSHGEYSKAGHFKQYVLIQWMVHV